MTLSRIKYEITVHPRFGEDDRSIASIAIPGLTYKEVIAVFHLKQDEHAIYDQQITANHEEFFRKYGILFDLEGFEYFLSPYESEPTS